MQARKRQSTATPDSPLTSIPHEDACDTAAASQEFSVRCMFGPDINASCVAERDRARQVQALTAMLFRRFVCQPPIVGIILWLTSRLYDPFYFPVVVEDLGDPLQLSSYAVSSMIGPYEPIRAQHCTFLPSTSPLGGVFDGPI